MTDEKSSSDSTRRTTSDRDKESYAYLETGTIICRQPKSDCTDADNEHDKAFTKGQTVFYASSQGVAEEAIILEVHLDDLLVPYYTIRLLASNREKQTHGARISTLSDLCKSLKPNLSATPSKPLRSILRPSSYGQKRRLAPVTPCDGKNDGHAVPPSSRKFLESIEKKLHQRKIREERHAQVVTPDCECQQNHRPDVAPKQLLYAGTRKRKRPYDDNDADIGETRERKRMRLPRRDEEEGSSTAKGALPFHFMPHTSKASSSTWQIGNNQRIYPELVPNIPSDWPINRGGYYPISFHCKHSQRDSDRIAEYQMILFDEILSKLENDSEEVSTRTGISMSSFLSPLATFLSSFSTKYLAHSWEFIRSKLSFGGASAQQALEEVASNSTTDDAASQQACSKATAADTAPSSTTSALRINVTRHAKSNASTTQQISSPLTVAAKPLLPRPPDRWQETFAIKPGHWKCKSCFHQNPSEAMTCDVCTALRDDRGVPIDAQRCDDQPNDQSVSSQSEGSGTDDSYTDSDTQTTSDAESDDNAQNVNGFDIDDCQTDCSSLQLTEDNSISSKATQENSPNTQSVIGNTGGRRLSSLALAAERIRADRARNAAFHTNDQSSSTDDEASETNRSKRVRRERNIELVDENNDAGAEGAMASTVTEDLDVIDLDLDPILEATVETDVESMSVTSNMSLVRSEMMMELDDIPKIKRGSNEMTANGKKQKFG